MKRSNATYAIRNASPTSMIEIAEDPAKDIDLIPSRCAVSDSNSRGKAVSRQRSDGAIRSVLHKVLHAHMQDRICGIPAIRRDYVSLTETNRYI